MDNGGKGEFRSVPYKCDMLEVGRCQNSKGDSQLTLVLEHKFLKPDWDKEMVLDFRGLYHSLLLQRAEMPMVVKPNVKHTICSSR
jgi:hypothetical protein